MSRDRSGPCSKTACANCSVQSLLPARRTPEVTYLCAKHGSPVSYREAARNVADLTGLPTLSHTTVRKDTVECGEYIENEQFRIGWLAGGRKCRGASHLRVVAIDGTVLTAVPLKAVRKFEVISGRVERDGKVARRFVSALQRPSLTRVLVAAALDQCGWVPSTMVDVVTDGARGMRSLVTSVVSRVTPRLLDWFHISMKLRAVQSPICARTYIERPDIMRRIERLLRKVRVHYGAGEVGQRSKCYAR